VFVARSGPQLLGFTVHILAILMTIVISIHNGPEALELGESLPAGGKPELVAGTALGVLTMLPLVFT
jgi:ZIP family zinc transporter